MENIDHNKELKWNDLIVIVDENDSVYVLEDVDNILVDVDVFDLSECTPLSKLSLDVQIEILKALEGDH